MTALERIKIILPLPYPPDNLLNEYLRQTEDLILSYTNRKTLPDALVSLQVNLAVYSVNRRGAEGEAERTEGEVKLTFLDIPPSAVAQMNNYRIARVPHAFFREAPD
jgi:hypothetical protein